MALNIDFSKETTRGVAIDLYRRYIREKHKFQVLYLGCLLYTSPSPRDS